MKESQQAIWLDMHKSFRRQIKWLSGAILLLGLTAIFDGQANYDRLSEEYHIAVDLILEEHVEKLFESEIKSVFVSKKKEAPEWEEIPGTILVELQDIDGLHRKYVRTLAEKNKEVFKIGNQSLGMAAYTLVLRFGSAFLLLAMLWPMLCIRKLHRHLAVAATPESFVQAKLNSLFFGRVTSDYGQGWRSHVFFSLLILFVIALSAPAFFVATRTLLRADLRVAITSVGNIYPLSDDPLSSRFLIAIHTPAFEQALIELLIVGLITSVVFILLQFIGLTTLHKTQPSQTKKS